MTAAIPERFLQARRAFLATCGEDEQPHVVPVCFAVVDKLLYIAIDEKPKSGRPLRRLRNIAENAKVSLTADVYDEDWSRLWWVMLQGSAAVIARGAERPAVLSALRGRYEQYRSMRLEDLPLIEVTVTRILSWQASDAG